jgi:hypothetical protein
VSLIEFLKICKSVLVIEIGNGIMTNQGGIVPYYCSLISHNYLTHALLHKKQKSRATKNKTFIMKKTITFFLTLLWVLSTTQAQLTFNEHDPIQTWKTINQVTEDGQGNIFVAAQDSYLKYDGSTWTELQVTGFTLGELTAIAADRWRHL